MQNYLGPSVRQQQDAIASEFVRLFGHGANAQAKVRDEMFMLTGRFRASDLNYTEAGLLLRYLREREKPTPMMSLDP
jgi:hypothetical protein